MSLVFIIYIGSGLHIPLSAAWYAFFPGLGQTFKDIFTKAIPFIPKQAVDPKLKFIYGDTKSQCAYEFADGLINGAYLNLQLPSRSRARCSSD